MRDQSKWPHAIVVIKGDQIQDVTFPPSANIGIEVRDFTDYVIANELKTDPQHVKKNERGEVYHKVVWEPEGEPSAFSDLEVLVFTDEEGLHVVQPLRRLLGRHGSASLTVRDKRTGQLGQLYFRTGEGNRVSRRSFSVDDPVEGSRYRDEAGRVWWVEHIEVIKRGKPEEAVVCVCKLVADDNAEVQNVLDVDLKRPPRERVPMIDRSKKPTGDET
jgi:hypothetical protein